MTRLFVTILILNGFLLLLTQNSSVSIAVPVRFSYSEMLQQITSTNALENSLKCSAVIKHYFTQTQTHIPQYMTPNCEGTLNSGC